MNKRQTYSIQKDAAAFKTALIHFFKKESFFFLLDSNHHQDQYANYDWLVAVGALEKLIPQSGDAFNSLRSFREEFPDWCFGWLTYDLKNEVEELESLNVDGMQIPAMQFVVPQYVFSCKKGQVELHAYINDSRVVTDLINQIVQDPITHHATVVKSQFIDARDEEDTYIKKAHRFLNHIKRGDIYEANFCTEFFAHDAYFDSIKAYNDLNKISEPPFAAYVRSNEFSLISASPERYLQKKGIKIISQPIKGTAARSGHFVVDESLKEKLQNDPKERSENVMIVDLVRNDLSRVAQKGSVQVEELFGVYTFKQVHQMISTITCELREEISAVDAIENSFPMGSMTGAPKISAMKIIEEQESFKRGLYSGSVGYFTPNDDFDFNVVIRSILYNSNLKYLSFSVGSALTVAAQPEKEYQECMLKARAMKNVLALQGFESR
ncbi:para-aminobenzoate synthase aminase component [Nonlabens tegetincola]|uniref:Para-aminobenzoate synthase aminase component n=1 Tax=Nonlabens tegetincola TaxID=323273 RepID=A0A090Q1S8_9FLAO|nr:anthranilate synthase component I family protein [Nonlabens tegetincola]GAK97004.1 para-aminobenzoate synthase aminase component [Nonlabens tegetincola]